MDVMGLEVEEGDQQRDDVMLFLGRRQSRPGHIFFVSDSIEGHQKRRFSRLRVRLIPGWHEKRAA